MKLFSLAIETCNNLLDDKRSTIVALLIQLLPMYSDRALWSAQFPRRGTPDLEHVATSSQEQ